MKKFVRLRRVATLAVLAMAVSGCCVLPFGGGRYGRGYQSEGGHGGHGGQGGPGYSQGHNGR